MVQALAITGALHAVKLLLYASVSIRLAGIDNSGRLHISRTSLHLATSCLHMQWTAAHAELNAQAGVHQCGVMLTS
jgi:hypothetical protein